MKMEGLQLKGFQGLGVIMDSSQASLCLSLSPEQLKFLTWLITPPSSQPIFSNFFSSLAPYLPGPWSSFNKESESLGCGGGWTAELVYIVRLYSESLSFKKIKIKV